MTLFTKPLSFKIIIGYHGFNANYNSETVFLKPRGRNPPLPLDRITSIHHIPFIFRILQGSFYKKVKATKIEEIQYFVFLNRDTSFSTFAYVEL